MNEETQTYKLDPQFGKKVKELWMMESVGKDGEWGFANSMILVSEGLALLISSMQKKDRTPEGFLELGKDLFDQACKFVLNEGQKKGWITE